jgi:hypothetical protein
MRDDDDDPSPSAPLEGRVVDDVPRPTRTTTPGSAAGAAEQADGKRGL